MFKSGVDKDIKLMILEARHAEEVYNLIEKERGHLRKWLPWVDSTKKVVDVRNFINSSLKQFADNEGFTSGIWYEGNFAGIIGLKINWNHKSASLGYWLGSAFLGKGIVTKSCRKKIQYAFSELGLHRVEIRCAEENVRSRSIPERLGITEEGKVRESEYLYDHYVSHVVYGMLDREWEVKM